MEHMTILEKQKELNRMTQESLALQSYIQELKARKSRLEREVRKLEEELAWKQKEATV